MKEIVLGYPVETSDVQECVGEILSAIDLAEEKTWLACLNPHSYAVALSDSKFSSALLSADWLIPDGIGIVYASRWRGGGIRQRVTGSDVFFSLHDRMSTVGGYSVFFLGASDETLAEIRIRMARDYPAIRVAGTYSPPFKPDYTDVELEDMVSAINGGSPDVLWVGMTAPKQEKWIFENIGRLDVRFAGAVGAVFDFYTGKVKRSHPLFQRVGLEWLPRLVQQPRRLWRRMFISAPLFLVHLLFEKFR